MLNHYLPIYKWTVVIQQIRREREYYMLQGLRYGHANNRFSAPPTVQKKPITTSLELFRIIDKREFDAYKFYIARKRQA